VEEFLRLSYHGFRVKDSSFNAVVKTDLSANAGQQTVIPQEIGRVLINLFNNAFYAVNERKKRSGEGYEPTVSVSTKKEGQVMVITVKDNGTGIPEKLLLKIYQPFFTTKPTGEGTGLGLSLCYDIITKVHGGELKVESRVGEGTEFVVGLPIE